MLHELAIENLGVIESARITLGEGLTCVTGETGAGKTMVLTGIGLILGAKTERATVRAGASEAAAEAVFDAPLDPTLRGELEDAGVRLDDDGAVSVLRTVGAQTRSRTVMGGRTVPQALLGDVASAVVTVHGQSDQQRLRSPGRQRELLDEWAGAAHAVLLGEYRERWSAWLSARAALSEFESGAQQQRAHVARLRDDVEAIDAVAPQRGEVEALEREIAVLDNAEAVRTSVALAHEALAGESEGAAVTALETARRALSDVARHDPALAELENRVADFSYGAADVATELSSYAEGLDADPTRLDAAHSRRSELAGLMRRIGVANIDAVIDFAEEARPQIAADDDWDGTLSRLRAAAADARSFLDDSARQLTVSRRDAATRLAQAVEAELGRLAMKDAAVAIEVGESEPAAHGANSVEFTLAAHPGAPHRPIAQAASGGELSRIMLAIEVALAATGTGRGHTFVFDEVDAGVGGKAAVAVGERLAQLAQTHQVIVVTHLAQVAAYATTHVVVEKATESAVTRAQVHAVTGDARVQEIARLLSGQDDSSAARAHAVELLEASSVAP